MNKSKRSPVTGRCTEHREVVTNMSDEDLIQQAYEEFIKNLFKNFYDAYTTSNNPTHEKAAEQIFQNAVKAARNARDRVLTILPK